MQIEWAIESVGAVKEVPYQFPHLAQTPFVWKINGFIASEADLSAGLLAVLRAGLAFAAIKDKAVFAHFNGSARKGCLSREVGVFVPFFAAVDVWVELKINQTRYNR